ncbi:MAG: prohibitin family protein [Acidaminococcaceae bacterium]|nr:prohibitin family protein [Acidaminococcaceae bacterium]
MDFQVKSGLKFGTVLFLALVAAGIVVNGATVIDTGETGVVLRLGKYSGTMQEGFNVKLPVVDQVVKMNIRETNSHVTTEVSSKDMQTIKLDLNLIYSLNPEEVGQIYKKYKTQIEQILITPTLLEVINSIVANYDIAEFVSHRSEISKKIENEFKNRVADSGLLVRSVSITGHDFDDKFNASITRKKIAQQDAEKAKYDLERVKLEAEAQKVKANTLTPLILQEKFLDKWDGKMPQYYSGNGLPFLTVK